MFISRQKAVLTAALILAAGVSPCGARADNSAIGDEAQLVYTLHTHLYAWSQSLPSSDEFQIAAVCFINDTTACADGLFGTTDSNTPDFEYDSEKRCLNEGYSINSCPDGYKPGGKKCPYGPYYSDCTKECPKDYISCEEPNIGVGEPCDGKYASCTCTPCGDNYYAQIPEGYIKDGEACLDCDGKTKYKVKINPCDGFLDCGSMGGASNAEICVSGNITKYDNCKPCPNQGSYTSCPTGAICEYENCSGLWYISGCAVYYDYYCTQPETNCRTLGYQQKTCNNLALKCPYDDAYVFCL